MEIENYYRDIYSSDIVIVFLVEDLVGFVNFLNFESFFINGLSFVISDDYLVVIDIYSDLREISGGENDLDLNFVSLENSFFKIMVVEG